MEPWSIGLAVWLVLQLIFPMTFPRSWAVCCGTVSGNSAVEPADLGKRVLDAGTVQTNTTALEETNRRVFQPKFFTVSIYYSVKTLEEEL